MQKKICVHAYTENTEYSGVRKGEDGRQVQITLNVVSYEFKKIAQFYYTSQSSGHPIKLYSK